jgi:hypothetical protein
MRRVGIVGIDDSNIVASPGKKVMEGHSPLDSFAHVVSNYFSKLKQNGREANPLPSFRALAFIEA